MLQLKLGKKSDKTRPILVKFASFENRDFVKKNAKNLKGSSYGISEQLPAEIIKIRKVKLPILKELTKPSISIKLLSFNQVSLKNKMS
jgi:hypothetical protein